MDGNFYEGEMPEPKHNIFLENTSMEYVSIQDMIDDVTVGDSNYELSSEEKEAVINYLKQYGIDVSSLSNAKPDNISQEEWDALYQKEKNKIKEC
jgi:predicted transcriptional regulator